MLGMPWVEYCEEFSVPINCSNFEGKHIATRVYWNNAGFLWPGNRPANVLPFRWHRTIVLERLFVKSVSRNGETKERRENVRINDRIGLLSTYLPIQVFVKSSTESSQCILKVKMHRNMQK